MLNWVIYDKILERTLKVKLTYKFLSLLSIDLFILWVIKEEFVIEDSVKDVILYNWYSSWNRLWNSWKIIFFNSSFNDNNFPWLIKKSIKISVFIFFHFINLNKSIEFSIIKLFFPFNQFKIAINFWSSDITFKRLFLKIKFNALLGKLLIEFNE